MYSKLSVAKTLLNLNIPVIISNGRTPDILSKLILGEGVGTYISKTNPPKHYKSVWISFFTMPNCKPIKYWK